MRCPKKFNNHLITAQRRCQQFITVYLQIQGKQIHTTEKYMITTKDFKNHYFIRDLYVNIFCNSLFKIETI